MKNQFKLLTLAASAAMMFAACSSDKLETYAGQPDLNPEAPSNAIQFGTYMGKTGTTRAISGAVNGGVTGAISSAQALAQHRGFGVFAYYTGTKTYNEAQYKYNSAAVAAENKLVANFMYNQRIEGTDAASPTWTYTPVKYWPNEIQGGDVDQQSAPAQGSSTYGGKVSFFAYAPYVATVGTEGITDFTSTNSTKGDPVIAYKVPETTNSVVDLLWGTKGSTGASVISGGATGATGIDDASGGTYEEALLTGYATNADLTKQEIDGKVEFAFKHALAKFGGFEGLKIIADVDEVKGSTDLAADTKVTVKSITIKTRAKNADASKYYEHQTGTFNLATGVWNITASEGNDPVDLATYEITNNMLNADIKDKDGDTYANQPVGVSGSTEKNVYADADTEVNPVIFIPGTRPELVVTIDYMVRTADTALASGYSEVGQKITKTVTFGSTVELNKYYKLIIRLGMTSVKFNATVSAWDDGTGAGSATEVNLPLNVD